MKKILKLLFVFILIVLNLTCLFTLSFDQQLYTSSMQSNASIVITVLENGTNKPIDNAAVCIIETKSYYSTNNNGVTEKIEVPVIRNQNFDNSLIRNFGEITILAYKPGYSDHIHFYEEVRPSQTKLGIIIKLTPIYSQTDTTPTITCNTPNKSWAEQLINIFKK